MTGLLGFLAILAAARVLRLPARGLWAGLGLWWLVLLLAHAPFAPVGAGALVGGNLPIWAGFGVLAGLVLAYRQGLRLLRARAARAEAPLLAQPATPSAPFGPEELDRYARHILLREIGGPGQKRLKAARVLVVGAGGLGSPALLYLAASGVGMIGVIDGDRVERSNLQRQIIHAETRIGLPKVFSAEIAMRALNPHVEIRPYDRMLDEETALALFADYDLILDGTDNFDIRYMVNRVAARLGKPLIAAAIAQWEGQIGLYDPARGGACYECVFPTRPAPGLVPSCAEAGVAAPLPGILGAMMAMEAVKHLTGAGNPLRDRLMIHDALYAETRMVTLRRRPDCPACGAGSVAVQHL